MRQNRFVRASRLEQQLARIGDLRKGPPDAVREELRALLGNRSQHIVAKAAQAAGVLQLIELDGELRDAFERFFANPLVNDPRTVALTEIVKALVALEAQADSVYLRGMRHRQFDSMSGDTAIDMRSQSGIGLARSGYSAAPLELAEMLRDEAPHCRASAARALAACDPAAAEPLLRFKALAGDPEPAVLEECLSALLEINPEGSLVFVKRFLASGDLASAESAAMALGGCRHSEALAVLTAEWRRRNERQLRRAILLAIATMRRDQAIEFLLATVAREDPGDARDAIFALRLHREDEKIRARLREVVETRGDRGLEEVFHGAFPL